jgi:hypothetical protein
MRIHGAKHSNMENKLFDRFCHVWKWNTEVDDQAVKMKADEIAMKDGHWF